MKAWLKQNRRRIFFGLLFCWFTVFVLVIPSLRPHMISGYYVTYIIDGYNEGDAYIRFPFAYFVIGFLLTLFRHPSPTSAALFCAYMTAPVILYRYNFFDDMPFAGGGFVVFGNTLFYLCFWAIGALMALLVRRIASGIRRRFGKAKDWQVQPESAEQPHFGERIRAWLTKDRAMTLLSVGVPLLFFVLYAAEIAATSPVGPGQDEVDVMYWIFGLPAAYFAGGLLCRLAEKPRYSFCAAAVALLSADTLWGVFDMNRKEAYWILPAAAMGYLLFFGMGIAAGYLIRQCIRDHRAAKQQHT